MAQQRACKCGGKVRRHTLCCMRKTAWRGAAQAQLGPAVSAVKQHCRALGWQLPASSAHLPPSCVPLNALNLSDAVGAA